MKVAILYAFASGSCGASLGKAAPLASAVLIVSGLVALGFVGIETGQKIGLLEMIETNNKKGGGVSSEST